VWLSRLGGASLLAVLLSCGCGERQPDRAAGPVKIRFAYQDRVADAASIVAVEKGYFAEEGIDIEPLVFSSGPACSEALLTGSADIGTMGDTTAVIAVSRAPVKIVASHGGGEDRHRIIVAADSRVRAPSDLVGKRVAVKKGTSTYGGLLAWADSVALDLSQVTVTDMRPPDMPDALLSGSVDAMVASEPTPSVVEEHGGRQLATLGGLGNTYPILLVAREAFLDVQPEAVRAFLRAIARGAALVDQHPDEAAAIMSQKTGLSPETAERAIGHHYYNVQLAGETMASLQSTADFLLAEGIIDLRPSFGEAADDSYLPDAG
jgi:aliphatic sulfonates family ABC transporter substrate-binding protein